MISKEKRKTWHNLLTDTIILLNATNCNYNSKHKFPRGRLIFIDRTETGRNLLHRRRFRKFRKWLFPTKFATTDDSGRASSPPIIRGEKSFAVGVYTSQLHSSLAFDHYISTLREGRNGWRRETRVDRECWNSRGFEGCNAMRIASHRCN